MVVLVSGVRSKNESVFPFVRAPRAYLQQRAKVVRTKLAQNELQTQAPPMHHLVGRISTFSHSDANLAARYACEMCPLISLPPPQHRFPLVYKGVAYCSDPFPSGLWYWFILVKST